MKPAEKVIALLLLTFFLAGCFNKPMPDTPDQRKGLALELARLSLSNGRFDLYVNQAVERGSKTIALKIKADRGKELAQAEYESIKKTRVRSCNEIFS